MQLVQQPGRQRQKRPPADQFDSPWREAMGFYFRSFVEFYFPLAYGDIDWDAGFVSLDTELRQIAGKSRASPLRSDSLFQVKRLSGAKQRVLIHAEVQTTRDMQLAKRIFRYNYRSFDVQGDQVASFAILGDSETNWRPNQYGWSLWGCEVGIRFPVVKLVDYEGREEELAASRNHFALMTQAFLATRKTKNDDELRRQWKMQIVRRLYEQDYTEEDVRRLFRVIDWMMHIDGEQEIIFKTELEQLEAEKAMRYVTSIERLAKKEGLEQGLKEGVEKGLQEGVEKGLQQGFARMLTTQLVQRFGQLPEWVSTKLSAATPEALENWGRKVLEVRSLEELFA